MLLCCVYCVASLFCLHPNRHNYFSTGARWVKGMFSSGKRSVIAAKCEGFSVESQRTGTRTGINSWFPQSLSFPRNQSTGQKTSLKHRSGLNASCTSHLSFSHVLSQESDVSFPADLPACDPAAAHRLTSCDGVPSARASTNAAPADWHSLTLAGGEDGRGDLRHEVWMKWRLTYRLKPALQPNVGTMWRPVPRPVHVPQALSYIFPC